MPYGKGTYGSQVGRPKKKTMLKGKQKTLPAQLKKKSDSSSKRNEKA